MQTVAIKIALKAMKKKATKKQLAERKKARDGKRNEGRDQSGGYSRVKKREELRLKEEEVGSLKEELKLKEEELGRLKEMEKGKKTWGRMGGGDGVVDFRREVGEEGGDDEREDGGDGDGWRNGSGGF